MTTSTPSTKNTESVERYIAAAPGAIFDLLADPARHHDIDGSGTVKQAPEGSCRLQLGDRFGMEMKMGLSYKMVSEVVEFDEDRRIAWQSKSSVGFVNHLIGGRIWRYELEPRGDGTLVRETWDISKEKVPAMVRPMRGKTRQNMERTLEQIERIVTA